MHTLPRKRHELTLGASAIGQGATDVAVAAVPDELVPGAKGAFR